MARLPLVRAALPFALTDADMDHIITKGAARWSLLSLASAHPVIWDLWRAEMLEGDPERLDSVSPSLRAISGRSLTSRAFLAVVLMIGFHGLALGVAALLVLFAYAEWQFAGRFNPVLVPLCLGGAALILWSIAPRFGRFAPPGPRLSETSRPRLFGELRSIAVALGQQPPAEVYLAPDVTAWAGKRGGALGFGRRPIMVLGLPLLALLPVSQLRAVVAHEFGHYHAGDIKLGPWVYKTRAALGRTTRALSWTGFLYPFLWYGRMFLRVTNAVSRAQEFSADRLAARTTGARPVVEALQATHEGAAALE